MQLTDRSLKEELSALTNKLYLGDPTALVYDIFKDTPDLNGLLSYLTGGLENAGNNEPCTIVREECGMRPSVEEWLARHQQLLPISGDVSGG